MFARPLAGEAHLHRGGADASVVPRTCKTAEDPSAGAEPPLSKFVQATIVALLAAVSGLILEV